VCFYVNEVKVLSPLLPFCSLNVCRRQCLSTQGHLCCICWETPKEISWVK